MALTSAYVLHPNITACPGFQRQRRSDVVETKSDFVNKLDQSQECRDNPSAEALWRICQIECRSVDKHKETMGICVNLVNIRTGDTEQVSTHIYTKY